MWEGIERCRREVAAVAGEALPRAHGEADLAGLLADVERIVSRELAAGRLAGEPPAACAPGCAACCTINVGTLAVEGAAAAAFLRARLGAGEAAALAARLADFHDRVRWMEDRERIAERAACPFLDDGRRCAIHSVRPLACRSVSSLDAADCRRALASEPDDEAPVVRMNLLQRALYEEARLALAGALGRAALDARARDVSGMTAFFLADAGRAAAFLAGARVDLE